MSEKKDRYRALCNQEDSIPLFSQAWWLDAVAEDAWDVCLVTKGDMVHASMPYMVKKKFGQTVISQPPLTQTLGPWIRPTTSKYAKRLSREKELMEALINQLPAYGYMSQSWHHYQTNWLAFYWRGFSQSTRYTYRIENLNNEDEIWGGLQQNIRTDIKKARDREQLTVRADLGIDDFFDLNRKVFERQGKSVPYTKALVDRLDQAAKEKGCRQILIAEDSEGRRHAGVYIVWDKDTAYYLMGGGDPALRNSGATSLCMWEAIRFAATVTKSFDFEGSMLEPVERFVRAFGATQTPYFSISKTNSKLIQTYRFLQDLRR